MKLTREEALQEVRAASIEYIAAQVEESIRHRDLKLAIRLAKLEGKLTQQEIADATVVKFDDDTEFRLSRQRISQIIHEEQDERNG